jgi:hypothetical protein
MNTDGEANIYKKKKIGECWTPQHQITHLPFYDEGTKPACQSATFITVKYYWVSELCP